MDSHRLAYLNALDIDVWERRAVDPAGDAALAAVGEERTAPDRSAEGEQVAQTAAPVSRARTVRSRGTAPAGADAAARAGEGSAAHPLVAGMGWDELATTVRSCTRCPLHATRTQSVFGVGDRAARWMVIGEAPGMEEDRQGEPFVGRAGQLLNAMLRAIGLAREHVFIANILKSRPPGNRDPRPEEVRACLPYLFRQIELVDPTLILCVGRIAAQTLLESTLPIGRLRGEVHRIAADRPMIVTYHPAYLLRSPGEKRKTWADLLLAMRTFEGLTKGAVR